MVDNASVKICGREERNRFKKRCIRPTQDVSLQDFGQENDCGRLRLV